MKYFKDWEIEGWPAIFGIIGTLLFILLIYPWLTFWIGYFLGWVAKIVIGRPLVYALELLGIIISKDQIPLLAGGLAWIGGFFHSINSSNKKG